MFKEDTRVLIVDDEQRFRDLLALLLVESLGVQAVAMGASDLRLWREVDARPGPSVVLLDWQMPVTHGGSVLTQIKARHPGMPVVVMSAGAFRDTARRLGCDDYLDKPFTLEEVATKLEPWLAEAGRRQVPASIKPMPKARTTSPMESTL